MKDVRPKNKNVARNIVSALLQPVTKFSNASVVGLAITSLWSMSEALAQQCTPTGTDQTCVNSQPLSGVVGLSDTSTLTLTNNTSTGIISGTAQGINAAKVIIQGNDGTIEATAANGTAILAASDADIINGSGTIQAKTPTGIAISGVNVTVTNGTGAIQGTNGLNDGIAIKASGTATLTANAVGGHVTGDTAAISAGTNVIVNGNDGTIEASDAVLGARAIKSNVDINVTNGRGTIQANGTRGVAIGAAGIASVTNGSGTIQANGQGGIAIFASVVNVIGNSGTIQATGVKPTDLDGIAIQAQFLGASTVHNLVNGIIKGGNIGILGAANANFDVTNDAGATIGGGSKGISLQGPIVSVTNAGTISGTAASVEFLGAGTNTLTLQSGSKLTGTAFGSTASANNQLILEGSGRADNDFQNFNSLTLSRAAWDLNGQSVVGTATVDNISVLTVGDENHPGAVLTGNVTIIAASGLEGQGRIVGNINVVDRSDLRPGNRTGDGNTSAGILNVTGNVVFSPTSNFVASTTPADATKLAVVGTATLGGATVVVESGGTNYAPSTKYTILTATGTPGVSSGVIGTFGKVVDALPFLTPSLTYDADDVFLTLQLTGAQPGTPGGSVFATAAQTRNQVAVASALDAAVLSATPVTNPLLLALLNLTTATDPRQAFDVLSGEVIGSVRSAQTGQMQFARTAMLGRMRQASYYGAPGELAALSFGGPELAYAGGDAGANAMAAVPGKAPARVAGPSRDLTFWAEGLGGWGHADSDGNAASVKSRFGGFLSGADARIGDTWRAGLVAGYMRTDLNVDDRSSSAGIDSAQFGGYAGGKLGAFNVRGGASYSYDSIDTSRSIFFPGFTDKTSAHFHGNVGQVFGEVGYGMALGSVALEPIAGLAYVHVRDGSFAESGGLAALSASSANESTGYSTLGLRAATAVPLANGTVLIPRGSVQWQYAFGDVTPVTALAFQSTGTSFTVAGIPIARNSALIEGGFDWRFSPQAKLGVFYQGELAAHADSHAFKGAFTWDF